MATSEDEHLRGFREAYERSHGGDDLECQSSCLPILKCFDEQMRTKLSMFDFDVNLHEESKEELSGTKVITAYEKILNVQSHNRSRRHHESFSTFFFNFETISQDSYTHRRGRRMEKIPIDAKSTQYFKVMASNRIKEYEKNRLLNTNEATYENIRQQQHEKFMLTWKTSLRDELGIIVDSGFEKRRQQKYAMNMVFYQVYTQKVVNAWQKWRDFISACNKHIMSVATLTIQRVARGFIGRMRAMRIKEVHIHTVQVAERREKEKRCRAQRAANKISHHAGKYFCEKKRRRDNLKRQAAQKMQALTRGMLARVKFIQTRLKKICCVIIQCFWRTMLAKRRTRVMYLIKAADVIISAQRATALTKNYGYKLDGASTILALAYSCHKMKQGLKVCVHWNRNRSVVPMQSLVRGWLCRIGYKHMLDKQKKDRIESNRCACQIQRIYRGYSIRNTVVYELRVAFLLERQERRSRKLDILKDSAHLMVKRKLIKFLHSIVPFRYIYEISSTIRIQRMWRGHRGRKSAVRNSINEKMRKWYKDMKYKENSILTLQKNYRGFKIRKLTSRINFELGIVRIQSVWRGFMMRNNMRSVAQRKVYVDFLCHILYGFALKMRLIRHKQQNVLHGLHANVIIYAARRYVRRIHAAKSLVATRLSQEKFLSGSLATIRAISARQTKILYESIQQKIGIEYENICGEVCPCLGPVQAIFIVGALGSKGKVDRASLASNRIAAIDCLKFLQRIGIVDDRNDRHIDKLKNMEASKSSKTQNTLLLSHSLGLVKIPNVSKRISVNDVDIQYNRSKDTSKGSKTLTFDEFNVFMSRIGSLIFNDAMKNEDDEQNVHPTSESKSSSFSYNLDCNEGKYDVGLNMWMTALFALSTDKWALRVLDWLEVESRAQLGVYARRMQGLVNIHKNGLWRKLMNLKKKENHILNEKKAASTLIKKVLRAHICKLRVKKLAQKFFVKYIPPDGHPYWFNPSTGTRTHNKPSILSCSECITIAMPPVGLEYLVLCPNCGEPAEFNCTTCDESLCSTCFNNMHSKGKRKMHKTEKIPYCAYCRFQMSTKSCSTCFLKPPQSGTVQELVDDDRGLFCDTCFVYLHNDEMQAKESVKGLISANKFYEHTKDSYLVGHSIQDDVNTDHMFTNLVERCEECNVRAASWRCNDCRQIYCSRCLLALHSIGGPFSQHTADPLPYYTPDMHSRFESDHLSYKMKKKMDLIKYRMAEQIKAKYKSSVLKVQSWWRMMLYKKKGQLYFKKCRRMMRLEYRNRCRETRLHRQSLGFQIANFMGMAPALSSDTKEETVLRKIPWILRHRARQYIWRNQADWGFYRKLNTDHKKGIPKVGFEIGGVEELIDQAKLGGYRMPGTIKVRNGMTKHKTTYNLSNFIQSGVLLRVKDRIFVCVNVLDNCEVTLDKVWLGEDGEEILYLLPSYRGERGRKFYKFLHWARSVVQNNPFVQIYASSHVILMTRIATFGAMEALKAKKQRKMKSFAKWDKFSKIYNRRAQWGKNLVTQYGSTVDLSDALSPEEIFAAKEAEELAKRMEKEKQDTVRALAKVKKHEALKAVSAAKKAKQNTKVRARKASRAVNSKEDSNLEGDSIKSENTTDKPEGWYHESSDQVLSRSSDDESDESGDEVHDEDKSDSISINTQDFLDNPRSDEKGEPWKASEEQLFERSQKEATMSRQELASYADEWIQYIDPLTDNEYYINKITNELSHVVPASVAMMEQLKEEEEKNKKDYDEAQRRLEKLSKVSKGGRRMVLRR